MNWRHLQAFLWLRWRLFANQARRGGGVNFVLMMIVTIVAVVVAVPLFIGCFLIGLYAFKQAAPVHLLYVWDGVVVAFAFIWGIGLVTELQRTETLSLSKFLHLPVSITSAFLINYASSLFNLTLILFVPAIFGLGLGLAFAKGWLLLTAWPLSAAFLLMVTALTYQFQGWLASLMSNPRRRRTVVVVTTTAFVLLFQLPNLLNVVRPWGQQRADQSNALVEKLAKLDRAFQAGEFGAEEHLRRQQEIMRQHELESEQAGRESAASWEQTARLLNLVLPIGWLPWGVGAAAEGRVGPAMLGFLGMMLIGAASLWRAHITTIRLYQGQFTAQKRRSAPSAAPKSSTRKSVGGLLEARLPGLSEPVSAVALAGLRSLIRSPEAKMMLLTPVLLCAVFGGLILRQPKGFPDAIRPFLAVGAMVAVLFGMLQLMANQFGFDRDGFRVFVLCAAARRDILLGKNLSFAPLALGLAAIALVILQVACPLRLDHLAAMLPQFLSMFLLFCVLMNLLSIYAPMAIAAGSLKPANPKLLSVLLQLAMFGCVFPLTQAPLLLPLGIEAALEGVGWTTRIPICLLLTLLECAVVIALYRFLLNWQGGLLQAREQKILEIVTNRAP